MKAFDDHRGTGVEMTRSEFAELYKVVFAALQNFEGIDEEIAEKSADELAELVARMGDVIASY